MKIPSHVTDKILVFRKFSEEKAFVFRRKLFFSFRLINFNCKWCPRESYSDYTRERKLQILAIMFHYSHGNVYVRPTDQ